MRVVAWLCGCGLLLAGCGDRPRGDGATAGAETAQASAATVLAVHGAVTVREAGGGERPAAPEMALQPSDTLITAPGAFVAVVLHNGYVVKLDEDLQHRVERLALFDRPPATRGLDELLTEALSPSELEQAGGAEKLLRIAGWNARRAAGETPAPLQHDRPRSEAKSAPAPEPPPGGGPADPVAAPIEANDGGARDVPTTDVKDGGEAKRKAKSRPDASVTKKSTEVKAEESLKNKGDDGDTELKSPFKKSSSPASAEADESLGSGAPPPAQQGPVAGGGGADLDDRWSVRTGPESQVQKASLPPALAGVRRALAKCLVEQADYADGRELLVRVESGKVTRVALDGGAPAPRCARELLVGAALPEVTTTTWISVRVRR